MYQNFSEVLTHPPLFNVIWHFQNKWNSLMKKSIIINIISWLGISLLLFFYLERQLAFHYFYIEQFRLFRFNQDYALQLFSHPGGISEYIA